MSSGLWRIPLPGDSDRVPVQPGDPLREFEELASHDWDPSVGPTEGDIRIQRGKGVSIAVDFSCAPLSGGDEWFSAGPWEIVQSRGPDDGLCREDFMSVGTGTLEEITNAARRNGLQIVLLTDHYEPNNISSSPRGIHDGVLFVPGVETRLGGDASLLAVAPLRDFEAGDRYPERFESLREDNAFLVAGPCCLAGRSSRELGPRPRGPDQMFTAVNICDAARPAPARTGH